MDRPPFRRRFTTVALAGFAGITAIAGVATGIAVPAGAASGTGSGTGSGMSTDGGASVFSSAMSSATVSTPASRAVVAADPATPKLLTAGQLTVSNRYGAWSAATAVKTGLPNPRTFCLKDTLPTEGTRYLTFRSAKGAFGEQYVTVTQSAEDATALIDTLRTSIQDCYKYWLDTVSKGVYKYGKIKASWSRYATFPDVEDGLRIYGVFTVPPKGVAKPMTHMFAIGRDDATVTVVHLGVTGEKNKAPRATFTADATEALEQLY